ncbi:PfkB family carbohydrate kinase [Pelobacter seleniigenes]|uniref:PfkB family carbohydrate kinase n=1 Tax=Pelobacter seleniigenes TaxID=407188 RepID=UPI0004A6F6B3|nr:PfkB family carbohydrate kinase [Pelobacter seleniigenes]
MQRLNRPLLFGEVLFDIFADKSVIGGAPFNVVRHLKGFGLEPLFISRIGMDELGQQILARMRHWQLDTSAIQLDPDHETGQVWVAEQAGQPSYTIRENQAYDHIQPVSCKGDQDTVFNLIYHGTLALREENNRNTLAKITAELQSPIFVDLNLRQPWWQPEIVQTALQNATWAKMSLDELREVTAFSGIDMSSLAAAAKTVTARYRLKTLFITDGENGSYCWQDGAMDYQAALEHHSFKDSVGAGDAFTAVCILGLLNGWPTKLSLARAAAFAAAICGERGALPSDEALYRTISAGWEAGAER